MRLIWVHMDCLHPESAAYRANPTSPSVFVWDDAEVERAGWSMKRIGFVYECLLGLPLEIRRGDPVEEVARIARERQCSGIVTMASPDPRIQAQAERMGAEVLSPESFAELPASVDLRRFSRYWSKAEGALFAGGVRSR